MEAPEGIPAGVRITCSRCAQRPRFEGWELCARCSSNEPKARLPSCARCGKPHESGWEMCYPCMNSEAPPKRATRARKAPLRPRATRLSTKAS